MATNIDADLARQLMDAARSAAGRAYAPYSNFPVGAAALTSDGVIVSGCNVENASYGLTVCAERVALTTAVAAGHREILAVAVTSPRVEQVTPCGTCRQFMNEFAPLDRELIVLLDGGADPELIPLSDLLPRSFGRSALTE
jgi:cytidine deaminase